LFKKWYNFKHTSYAWYDLAKGPYTLHFESDGLYHSWALQLSASGVEIEDSFQVFLDGIKLNWTTVGHLDRAFYSWKGSKGLSKGNHSLEFRQGLPASTKNIRQLCSLALHEYGATNEFESSNTVISAYPTFSLSGKKSFRPTNEGCLMRNMSSTAFCPGKRVSSFSPCSFIKI
jgi:hypothetical protein